MASGGGGGLISWLSPLLVALSFGTMILMEKVFKKYQSTTSFKNVLFICTTCSVSKRENGLETTVKNTNNRISGLEMFRNVTSLFARKNYSNTELTPESVNPEESYEFTWPNGATIKIQPQKCLSACKRANCIAFTHPNKYQYHFAMLDADQPGDIEDIVKFTEYYVNQEGIGDAFTKKGDRPIRLGQTIISRLPPLIPLPS